MSRPLALIEGALALPNSRPLSGLPPPFGSWRRSASYTQPRVAQPAKPGAPRYAPTAHPRVRTPSQAKFLFLYKLPQRPSSDSRIDEQLAEARRYLEARNVCPYSSRSDRILGAAIFVGCSIALAWLLATCSTHDVTGTAATAAAPSASAISAASPATGHEAKATPNAIQAPPRAERQASSETDRSSPALHHAETAGASQQQAPQANAGVRRHAAASDRLAAIHRSPRVAASPNAGIERQRAVSSRPIDSPARLSLSPQRESTASQSSANDSAERAALLDWAAQQRRANAATRPIAPVASDIDWNAHMTQRRITDNPSAFQAGRTPPAQQ